MAALRAELTETQASSSSLPENTLYVVADINSFNTELFDDTQSPIYSLLPTENCLVTGCIGVDPVKLAERVFARARGEVINPSLNPVLALACKRQAFRARKLT